jgi:hypothetical protein
MSNQNTTLIGFLWDLIIMNRLFKREPVLSWAVAHAGVNTAQILAIPMAPWLHAVIVVVTALGSAFGARQQVTPDDAVK